jgi:hypothetical protein
MLEKVGSGWMRLVESLRGRGFTDRLSESEGGWVILLEVG